LIDPVSVSESGLVAQRALNLSLSIRKLARDLGITLPDQAQGVQRFYELYRQDYPNRLRSYGFSGQQG
jgi:dTDP-4-dehydrorhamnose reductase